MKRRRIEITFFRRRITRISPNETEEDNQPQGSTMQLSDAELTELLARDLTDLTPSLIPKSEKGEMVMNTKKNIVRTLVAVGLTLGLFQLPQSTSAHSTTSFTRFNAERAQKEWTQLGKSNCKKIHGNGVQTFDPVTGTVSGPITNSGILDGDLQDVINFGAGFIFTPDPTVVTYTTALTITTIQGQVKLNPVTTQSVVTGSGNEFGNIDSDNSTGRFAGATGTIWITFRPTGDPNTDPYEAELIAQICFAQS